MDIQRREENNKGRFFIQENGTETAEMTYSVINGKEIVIESTEVDKEKRGQGLGKKLVMASVDYARNNDLQIIPACPFAEAVFEKNDNIRDVWEGKNAN
ncbi:GNAT family N-acetyltransferase [Marivirga lumbricoides]|uniref:GNAT family N-acetyltransferase n=1 Tax=Marivirga lumbricoides TaxID=1046115 RepID=A0A2T4DIW2_9BACT|nr:GNAT family N-acetyltransferase [Marivirga lumbricoides]